MYNVGSLHPEYPTYPRQLCFVGHVRAAEWTPDLLSACAKVLPRFGLEPWYAADHFDPTRSLRAKVVQLIANARYGVYDLSCRKDKDGTWRLPRNVLIELGMAIALNRPALLLRHTSNAALPLPAVLQGVELLEFAGETTLERTLEARLPQWLDVPPERDWLNRFCILGARVCHFREAHPRAGQWSGQLRCLIADGLDKDHPRFQPADRDEVRATFEEVFGRYNNLAFVYLDEVVPAEGYQYTLCGHCQAVRAAPFAVYQLTPQTPAEVFIAIGMSIALETLFEYDIPKVLVVRAEEELPSLLRGYEVIEAANSSEAKKKLKACIPALLRKVRETMWKARPLPFIETVAIIDTDILKKQSDQSIQEESITNDQRKVSDNASRNLRILVADDDIAMTTILEILFRNAGYEVVIAGDGREAIEKIIQEHFDLLILDIMMPEFDGVGVFVQIKDHFQDTPIFIITALNRKQWFADLEAEGAVIIQKPFDTQELLIRVRETIGNPYITNIDEIVKITSRQKEILKYIENFVNENGYPPAIRKIQRDLSISSTSVVTYNLKVLESKGLLKREGRLIRSISRLTSVSSGRRRSTQVPLLGVITAGQPLPTPEDISIDIAELVDVPLDVAPAESLEDVYALRVRGHSLIDALIDDGDIVLLRYQETAENGQLVAITIEEEEGVTLRRFYREENHVRLQPANVTIESTYVEADKVQIQGRVVGILRPSF